MKVLIIGDSGSIFVKQYIEYVLLPLPKIEIVLIQENSSSSQYLDFYRDNGVFVEPLVFNKNKWLFKIPIVRSFLGVRIWCKKIKKKYGCFDMLHIHGLNRSRGNIGHYLNGICKKNVISVWGDEIFRQSPKNCKSYMKYYDKADTITVSTKAMLNKFNDTYGNIYVHKIVMNKFAIGLFDKIDNIKRNYSRESLCKMFGIDNPEKKIVFVGHNGREAQRHIELTSALNELSIKDRKQIVLVYTMTYGVKSNEYLLELENRIKEINCDYVILSEFLDEEMTAKLRCICDILLHAQLTDAFSASIQESLYSGSIVVNGSWLPYEEIPQYRQHYIEYDDISEISNVLSNILDKFDEFKDKYRCNKDVLRSISSVENTTTAWINNLNI